MKQSVRRREAAGILAVSSLVSALAVVVVVFVAAPAAASDDPASHYSVLNGTANAATQHVIAGSSAFPNFRTGAIDNYYSLAHAYVDNSPFAEGTSSPADTGPLGQTAAAGNFSQPQYADARWSGQQADKQTFGNQGGPYAISTADTYKATAEAMAASGGSSGSSGSSGSKGLSIAAPKGLSSRLHTALAAWKARWLPKLDLKKPPLPVGGSAPPPPVTVPTVTVPTVTVPLVGALPTAASTTTTPTTTTTTTSSTTTSSTTTSSTTTSTTPSSSPDNAALDSSAQVMLDPTSSALVTSGESSLGRVSIGGAIVIKGLDVTASITNDGTPKDKIAVDIGAVTIGGVPVTIDQNGVTVNGQTQDLSQVYGQADAALNAALKQAGVQLFTVQPEITKTDNQETVTASGLDVQFVQPAHQGGVPDQYVQHLVGEVYVDSLAVPGTPFSFNIGGTGGSGGSGSAVAGGTAGGSSTGVGGIGGSSGGSSQLGTGTGLPASSSSSQPGAGPAGSATQGAPMVLAAAFSKPVWLLLSYFVWQVLVILTGASLWRWRMGGAL